MGFWQSIQQFLAEGFEIVPMILSSMSDKPDAWEWSIISITPTPSRWKHWPAAREANRLIQAHTTTDPRLHFIDMTDAILGSDGRPNRDLFRLDRLHPNPAGYAKWTATIKPVLLADLHQH